MGCRQSAQALPPGGNIANEPDEVATPLLLAWTREALCRIALDEPPPLKLGGQEKAHNLKRKRFAGRSGAESDTPGGNVASTESFASSGNLKVMRFVSPALLLDYFPRRPGSGKAPLELLLVERQWADVKKAFPAPLYRPRFGI